MSPPLEMLTLAALTLVSVTVPDAVALSVVVVIVPADWLMLPAVAFRFVVKPGLVTFAVSSRSPVEAVRVMLLLVFETPVPVTVSVWLFVMETGFDPLEPWTDETVSVPPPVPRVVPEPDVKVRLLAVIVPRVWLMLPPVDVRTTLLPPAFRAPLMFNRPPVVVMLIAPVAAPAVPVMPFTCSPPPVSTMVTGVAFVLIAENAATVTEPALPRSIPPVAVRMFRLVALIVPAVWPTEPVDEMLIVPVAPGTSKPNPKITRFPVFEIASVVFAVARSTERLPPTVLRTVVSVPVTWFATRVSDWPLIEPALRTKSPAVAVRFTVVAAV